MSGIAEGGTRKRAAGDGETRLVNADGTRRKAVARVVRLDGGAACSAAEGGEQLGEQLGEERMREGWLPSRELQEYPLIALEALLPPLTRLTGEGEMPVVFQKVVPTVQAAPGLDGSRPVMDIFVLTWRAVRQRKELVLPLYPAPEWEEKVEEMRVEHEEALSPDVFGWERASQLCRLMRDYDGVYCVEPCGLGEMLGKHWSVEDHDSYITVECRREMGLAPVVIVKIDVASRDDMVFAKQTERFGGFAFSADGRWRTHKGAKGPLSVRIP